MAATGPKTVGEANGGRAPSLGEATGVWLKLGVLGFGGPAAQIAMMHRIVVDEKHWIDEVRFLHALNYCMLLPGPEAHQLAIYLGWMLHGARGGIIAGILFVVPGAVVMLALTILYVSFRDVAIIDGLLFGLKAAVLAIVIEAVLRVGRRALAGKGRLAAAAVAFIAIFLFAVPFPLIVAGAGIIGALSCRWSDIAGRTTPGTDETAGHIAIGDPPATSHRATAATALACAALWLAPTAAAAAIIGWSATLTQIGLFFSKMAVVTFGGAYAVLSYVAQRAVDTYGWLEPGEMLQGLGLAETTPGPLILVVQFVAFLGAYRDPLPFEPMTAAVLGGLLATWVTFVPSFLWIFLGAPYIERVRHNRLITGALAMITAAVVGVIVNLAVWFALHVLFAKVDERWLGPLRLLIPDWASLDVAALALAAVSVVLVFLLKASLLTTFATASALGALLALVL
jgi:chromate transporter